MLLRLPAFFVDVFNSDETFLATQAQVIREGGDLYREAADRKPPLVPYIYAATFEATGTTALWTVRVVAMLAVAGTALMIALEARRRAGRRAMWIGGVLTVVALVAFAPQDGQAANFEVFMLPAMVAGVLLARRGRSGAAGVAIAFATLAKQTGAATLLPVFYLLWKRRGKRGIVEGTIGFLIPLALVALWLGPHQILYWTVLGNGSYVGLQTASFLVVAMFVLMTFGWAACNIPILWTLPRSWRDRRIASNDGDTNTDLWLWLFSAAISVGVGLRFFGHYYLQLVPPLALLAAIALSRSSQRAVPRHDDVRAHQRTDALGRGLLHEAVRSPGRLPDRSAGTSPRTRRPTTACSCGATCPRSTGRRACDPRPATSPRPARSWPTCTRAATKPSTRA